jgi:hypothetical protein
MSPTPRAGESLQQCYSSWRFDSGQSVCLGIIVWELMIQPEGRLVIAPRLDGRADPNLAVLAHRRGVSRAAHATCRTYGANYEYERHITSTSNGRRSGVAAIGTWEWSQ